MFFGDWNKDKSKLLSSIQNYWEAFHEQGCAMHGLYLQSLDCLATKDPASFRDAAQPNMSYSSLKSPTLLERVTLVRVPRALDSSGGSRLEEPHDGGVQSPT